MFGLLNKCQALTDTSTAIAVNTTFNNAFVTLQYMKSFVKKSYPLIRGISSSLSIAALYKARRNVEIFFKQLWSRKFKKKFLLGCLVKRAKPDAFQPIFLEGGY